MYTRTRVDGHKFEEEFEKLMAKQAFPHFLIRLRTPSQQYAGVTNIADYILFSHSTHVLELKETSKDVFYLSQINQKDELERFKEYYKKAKSWYNWTSDEFPVRAVVIIHFIKESKYAAYPIDEYDFKPVRTTTPECLITDTLQELLIKVLETI